jgi:hypothetical protein
LLAAGGVDSVLINTHYLAGAVREFVAASKWRDRITLAHEEELLGTGGPVLRNRAFPTGLSSWRTRTIWRASMCLHSSRAMPRGLPAPSSRC